MILLNVFTLRKVKLLHLPLCKVDTVNLRLLPMILMEVCLYINSLEDGTRVASKLRMVRLHLSQLVLGNTTTI